MDTKNIKQLVTLPCSPEKAYEAWMDSKKHGEMIDGKAKIDAKEDGEFSIWDGSITGKTLKLDSKKHRIVQLWRYEYDDWPKDYFSKVGIEFVPYKNGQCKVRFWHTGIPSKYADEISQGWKEYYWEPMEKYFQL